MTLTLNDTLVFHPYFPIADCFCNKVLIENDRKYYLSATYVISRIESQGESLHSARKCCIFAPAIERTALCALLGSSIKTNTGHK